MLERATTRTSASCCSSTPSTTSSAPSTTRCCSPTSSCRRTGWSSSDQPVTADALMRIYAGLLEEYYGDALTTDARAKNTWARIPHFFQSPYYVYQYATCFASHGQADGRHRQRRRGRARAAVDRYLGPAQGGGSDHPMRLLKRRRRRSQRSPPPCGPSSSSWTGSSAAWRRSSPADARDQGRHSSPVHRGSPLTMRSAVRSRTTGFHCARSQTRLENVAGAARTSTS